MLHHRTSLILIFYTKGINRIPWIISPLVAGDLKTRGNIWCPQPPEDFLRFWWVFIKIPCFFERINTVLAKENVLLQAQNLKNFRLRRAMEYISNLIMIVLARRRRTFLGSGVRNPNIPPCTGWFQNKGDISRNSVDTQTLATLSVP